MKRILRACRSWALRPVENELRRSNETLIQLQARVNRQEAYLEDLLKVAARPTLQELEATLSRTQLDFEATLTKIRDEQLSFARFGDGEFKLMLRPACNLKFQRYSPALARDLKTIFEQHQRSESNVLLGFPTLYRDLHWSRVWLDIWPEVRGLISADATFGNSHVSRPIFFQTLNQRGVDLWTSLWADREIVIVTGRGSRMTLIPELFSSSRNIWSVDSEPINAYDNLTQILLDAESHFNKGRLFLVALGPAGTVLTHDLAERGEQALDVGHISDSYQNVFAGEAWPESKPVLRSPRGE